MLTSVKPAVARRRRSVYLKSEVCCPGGSPTHTTAAPREGPHYFRAQCESREQRRSWLALALQNPLWFRRRNCRPRRQYPYPRVSARPDSETHASVASRATMSASPNDIANQTPIPPSKAVHLAHGSSRRTPHRRVTFPLRPGKRRFRTSATPHQLDGALWTRTFTLLSSIRAPSLTLSVCPLAE